MSRTRSTPSAARPIQLAPMGPVVVAEHLGRLQKFVLGQALLEFGPGDEVILLAVPFLAARRAGGVGNRKAQVRDALHQLAHQGRFARARRRGNDEDRGHSGLFRLSDCSRIFSMAALARQRQLGDLQPDFARAAGLGQDRIGLAIHFLQQEVQLLADFAAGVQQQRQVAPNGSSGGPVLRRCRCDRPAWRLPGPAAADRSARP